MILWEYSLRNPYRNPLILKPRDLTIRRKFTPLENPTIHGGGDIKEDIFYSLEGGIQSSVPSNRVYFFGGTMASLQALATRIFTTVFAGMLIGSPVAGFFPTRAFRFPKTSLPMT